MTFLEQLHLSDNPGNLLLGITDQVINGGQKNAPVVVPTELKTNALTVDTPGKPEPVKNGIVGEGKTGGMSEKYLGWILAGAGLLLLVVAVRPKK